MHIWDKYGKLSVEDAVPGLPLTDGLFIDRSDNVYALVAGRRMLDGKPYPLITSETLMISTGWLFCVTTNLSALSPDPATPLASAAATATRTSG